MYTCVCMYIYTCAYVVMCMSVYVCKFISLDRVSVRENLWGKSTDKLQTCWEEFSASSEWKGLTRGTTQRPVEPGCHYSK